MKILAHNYYHGPSIVGNFRALRWVIKPPDTQLELGEAGRQARALFIQATGREPDYCGFLSSEYGAMVLAFALALQRARYHPVCQGTVRILEDERIEVAVEVVRSRMVEPLARCVAALLDARQDIEPADVGQANIGDDEVEERFSEGVERGLAVGRGIYVVARGAQIGLEPAQKRLVVFDKEQAVGHDGLGPRAGACAPAFGGHDPTRRFESGSRFPN